MTNQSVVNGVVGVFIGVIIAGFAAGQAVNNNYTGIMRMMGINSFNSQTPNITDHKSMSMMDMNDRLVNLSGEDFDKTFVEMMIAHHEGALDMANLIPSRAKHDELKSLGKEIISAQTKEIIQMKQWQSQWGYSGDEMMQMMH